MPDVSDAQLAHASEVLLRSALHLREHQRIVVVADADTARVGDALTRAATGMGAAVTLARLDQLKSVSTGHTGDRPHKVLPDLVRRAMLASQASVFVASSPHQELSMREQLLHIVAAWGRAMFRRLEFTQHVHTTSAAGTDLELTFGADPRWVPRLGTLAAGKWVNFPAGAIYASPLSADGILVVNASLGEFFGAREGLLLHKPLFLTFEAGRVVKVEAPMSPELESDIRQMLAFAPNSDRVGLVAIGVNDGIEVATGEAVVDQNLPGLHLFVGDPSGRATGVRWSARTSFAACQAGSTVTVDGMTTIDHGRLALS